MTMITPSYLGETIEYSSLHACRSTLEDPTCGTESFLIDSGPISFAARSVLGARRSSAGFSISGMAHAASSSAGRRDRINFSSSIREMPGDGCSGGG